MDWKIVDYRKLRSNNLHSEQFRHLELLLFWPVFGMLFSLVERGGLHVVYHTVWCPLDDQIPFCEAFLIPYLFWFLYLGGMLLYGLLFDPDTFRKMMRFIILTYFVTLAIYLIYPTMQQLRPETFARDNVLTRFTARFYRFDTNTNVCPSIHVIGSFAAMYAAWNSKHFSGRGWRIAFALCTVLISVSTLFMKQHSVLDVLFALPLCFAAYPIAFGRREERRARLAERKGTLVEN